MKLAHEGNRIIFTLLFIIAILIFLVINNKMPTVIPIIFSLVLLFCINFFRDPKRSIPIGGNHIISPADGKIISIETIHNHDLGKVHLVSIFLNIFNVHVNRMPYTGKFSQINYKKGRFLMAFDHKASDLNERNEIIIESNLGKIKIIQIAGLIARRIICYAKKDKTMEIGGRLGFMLFGSRVDLVLPINVHLKVRLGQKVMGNKTIIATFD